MKNNIIIAGVPRAGKSTVSHLLSKKYGYQHVSMDSIIAGFVLAMMNSGEYDEFEPGMVLDMYQLLPEDYDRFVRGANCDIAYFITSDVTPEERFAIQKKYDTEKDYTFWKSDEELREGAEYIVEQSLLIKEQCIKYGLRYYETAREREQSIQAFLRDFGLTD